MDGEKLLRNVAVGSFFLWNCAFGTQTQTANNEKTKYFWVHDLGFSLKDQAFFGRFTDVGFDMAEKMYWAVKSGNKILVKRLLTENIDVNMPLWDDHKTILHYATLLGSISITRSLLDNGANPNLKDKEGCLPIHYAAHCGSGKKIALLLDHNADPNAKDNKGYTPLMWAVHTILFEMGRKGYPKPKDILRHLSPQLRAHLRREHSLKKPSHYFPAMQLLVSRGAIPNAQDNEGNTALHLAVSPPNDILYIKCPSLELLEELVALGVDVNIRNKKGETVLDLLQKRKEGYYSSNKAGDDQCDRYIARLLEQGIDINIPNEDGNIPADLVRQEKERLYHEKEIISAQYNRIIEFLLEHGAVKSTSGKK
jgi:ankyrin repeat protein